MKKLINLPKAKINWPVTENTCRQRNSWKSCNLTILEAFHRPAFFATSVILAILYPDICWHKTEKITVRFWLNINGRGYNKCKLVKIGKIHRKCLTLIKFRSSDRDFLLFYSILFSPVLLWFISSLLYKGYYETLTNLKSSSSSNWAMTSRFIVEIHNLFQKKKYSILVTFGNNRHNTLKRKK